MAASNLYGLTPDALTAHVESAGEPPYRARQLYRAMYRGDRLGWDELHELPQALREALAAKGQIARPQIVRRSVATDGTTKCVLELPAGGEVEAVAIPADDRMTFCISSQVGCAFGCAFCMTARLGFQRHLDAGEIVGQVAALMKQTGTPHERYNIVFMGMGEPLHNTSGVFAAIELLMDENAFGLGPKRVTVSTVGLPKGIDAMNELPVVPRLAVSLVTADPQLRASLMPIARRVAPDELADAVRRFGRGKRDRPTFEVVMLDGVNDLPGHAEQLARLARRAEAKVNLIEFNPTPELPYRPSPEERIQSFLRVLSAADVVGTVRRSRGKDIDAACGQLAFTNRSTAPAPSDQEPPAGGSAS